MVIYHPAHVSGKWTLVLKVLKGKWMEGKETEMVGGHVCWTVEIPKKVEVPQKAS